MTTKRRLRERRLRRLLDWISYVACATLVAVIAWLATTRPSTLISFTGTSSRILCDLAPVPTVSGEGELIEHPHLHASADAIIVTGTTLSFASDDDGALDAKVLVPKSPQATAVIKFESRYTVRLFMHKGNTLSLIPGKDVPVAATKPWSALGMPNDYTIAFQFHYQPDALLWKVVGTENMELTVKTSGFDHDWMLEKTTGKRLEISGIPHPFQSVPIALGCCSSDWAPLMGQLITLGPSGQTANYVPMLFVKVRTNPGTELVEAAPLMCERASLDGAVGELSVSPNKQSLNSPVSLSLNGNVEVGATSDHEQIKYSLSGAANSLIVDSHELVPTRLDAIGPFWAGLLSTVAAAFVIALIATKAGFLQEWLRK